MLGEYSETSERLILPRVKLLHGSGKGIQLPPILFKGFVYLYQIIFWLNLKVWVFCFCVLLKKCFQLQINVLLKVQPLLGMCNAEC